MAKPRHKILTTERQFKAAASALARQCEIMSLILKRTGIPPARRFPADFSGLSKIIVGQQLSAQSAAAIWGRVSNAFDPFEPSAFLASNDADLKALGLSNGKIRSLRALSQAVVNDELDFSALNTLDDAAIIEKLTSIHGIGPWTADIYILFALARQDAFASGDLALQLAAQHHFKLKTRPTAQQLERIAERWRPSRAVAAHLLWADYSFARGALREKAEKKRVIKSRKTLK
ncbi:DNA-3-methyladenine glycosylase 2 family protein [Hyphomicrobium sp.]|uniref:DNA-3-methyladenine glycosylase family protein n=1 Tax=Hyphomicrobium sp. TaxID=82 RepID=UPI002BB473CE|nr:DNA-3-methyladenine glycosylase 2 family protein [Hyphomicrobium sp.]HVZ05598.1 DNA-3-methyladenine glycosylase 2 family protein [Hyphomicrobium sp.]